MAEPLAPLTTEDYTHEEAIARIDLLEEAIEEALEALAAHKLDEATEILDDALAEADEACDEEDEDTADLEEELEDD